MPGCEMSRFLVYWFVPRRFAFLQGPFFCVGCTNVGGLGGWEDGSGGDGSLPSLGLGVSSIDSDSARDNQ